MTILFKFSCLDSKTTVDNTLATVGWHERLERAFRSRSLKNDENHKKSQEKRERGFLWLSIQPAQFVRAK